MSKFDHIISRFTKANERKYVFKLAIERAKYIEEYKWISSVLWDVMEVRKQGRHAHERHEAKRQCCSPSPAKSFLM